MHELARVIVTNRAGGPRRRRLASSSQWSWGIQKCARFGRGFSPVLVKTISKGYRRGRGCTARAKKPMGAFLAKTCLNGSSAMRSLQCKAGAALYVAPGEALWALPAAWATRLSSAILRNSRSMIANPPDSSARPARLRPRRGDLSAAAARPRPPGRGNLVDGHELAEPLLEVEPGELGLI